MAAPSKKLVCFSLGEQVFALPIDAVKEAVELRPITPVFLVPAFIRGIMNLRGEVVAVIDLQRFLGLEVTRISEQRRVVVVQSGTGRRNQRTAGLLADSLCGVVELDTDEVQPPPATLPRRVSGHLRGLVSRAEGPVLILDIERVFDSEQLAPHRRGAL